MKRGRGRPRKTDEPLESGGNLLAGLSNLDVATPPDEEEPPDTLLYFPEGAPVLSDDDLTMTTADLCQATGYAHPAISNFVSIGLIKPKGRGLWPLFATFKALFGKLKERAEKRESESKTRRNQIDDDLAELKLLTQAKKVIPLAAAKQFWSDARIEIRQVIERSTSLTSTQKNSLLLEISKLRTAEPEAEEE